MLHDMTHNRLGNHPKIVIPSGARNLAIVASVAPVLPCDLSSYEGSFAPSQDDSAERSLAGLLFSSGRGISSPP